MTFTSRWILSLFTLSFASLATAAPIGNPNAPKGGTYYQNLGAEPTTVNPITYTDIYASGVHMWVLDGLLDRNIDTFEWEPALAAKWEVSKDGKTFTFTLRDGITFHDGKPVTAEDVKFSFDVFFDPNFKAAHRRPYYEGIEKVEVMDPKTVRFTTKNKYFQNFDIAAGMAILPKHIYSDSKNKKLNREIVGTGPYKLASYEKGKRITLEKNKDWWGNNDPNKKGEMNFDKIVLRFIQEENVEIESLKKGDIDYLALGAEAYMKKAVGPEWGKKVFKVEVENKEPKGFTFIGWNLQKDLFQDKKVRVAMAHLFNRQMIIEKFLYNKSVPATGPWHFQNEAASPKVKPIPFDTKAGLKLLNDAGWSDSDKDGVLDKKINGKKVDFKFTLLTANPDTMKYYTIFKEDAKKAGVDVELKLVEWNTFTKILDERNFDAVTLGWSGQVEVDPKQIWHSSSDTKSGSNFVGYKNAQVDKLIDEARETMDRKKRHALLQKVYELIADDAPYLFLFNAKYSFYAHTARMKRPKDTFKFGVGLSTWWIEK